MRVVTPFTLQGVIDPTPIAFVVTKKIPNGTGLSIVTLAELPKALKLWLISFCPVFENWLMSPPNCFPSTLRFDGR